MKRDVTTHYLLSNIKRNVVISFVVTKQRYKRILFLSFSFFFSRLLIHNDSQVPTYTFVLFFSFLNATSRVGHSKNPNKYFAFLAPVRQSSSCTYIPCFLRFCTRSRSEAIHHYATYNWIATYLARLDIIRFTWPAACMELEWLWPKLQPRRFWR